MKDWAEGRTERTGSGRRKGLRAVLLGLLMLCGLWLMAGVSPVMAESQPSKSAAQWSAEGYTVVDLSGVEGRAGGFIVLDKGVTYLKETSSGGIRHSGNTFILSSGRYQQSGSGTGKRYCVLSEGQLFFGIRNGSSAGSALILDQLETMNLDNMSQLMESSVSGAQFRSVSVDEVKAAFARAGEENRPLSEKADVFSEVAGAYMPYTSYAVGAWIDDTYNIDYSKVISGLPVQVKGTLSIYLDHRSDDPGYFEPTHHKVMLHLDLNLDSIGLSSTGTTSTILSIPIYKAGQITLLSVNLELDDFKGTMDFAFKSHFGFTIKFDTYGIPVGGFDGEYDSNNGTWGEIHSVNATGRVRYVAAAGPKLKLGSFITLGLTFEGGVLMDGTIPARYSPADTKVKWHACNDCVYEELRPVLGPVVLEISLMDWDWATHRWTSPEYTFDRFYDFYVSNTFGDYGKGTCPHYGYRLNVKVINQDGDPMDGAQVSYATVPSHYETQSTGVTGLDGRTILYPPAGSEYQVTATLTSPTEETRKVTGTATVNKTGAAQDLTVTLNIPSKTLAFRDNGTGDLSNWPEDITFVPFYSNRVKIPDNVPSRSGLQFTGWNTMADGTGADYAPGATLTLEDDQILWAQWQIAGGSWFIVYNANGGTGAPGTQMVPRGQDAVLTTEQAEWETMTFLGWTEDLVTREPVYQPGGTLPYDSSRNVVELYALWELNPITRPVIITFDANGLSSAGIPANLSVERGTWLQLQAAVPPFGSDSVFLGWSEDAAATEPEYSTDRAYRFDRDTNLYAIWGKADTLRLYFRDPLTDSASGMPETIEINSSLSRNVRIPDQMPQKSGRVFTGWNTAADGSGTAYVPGSVIVLTQDTVLWAQWEIAGSSWYVVYNANGGTSAPEPQIVPRGQDAVLSTVVPERGTTIFRGWTTDLTAGQPVYQPGATLPYDSEKNVVVLYAQWELSPVDRPVTVTFNANGVTSAGLPETVSMESGAWMQMPAATAPFGSSRVFRGWNTNAAAAEPEYLAGNTYRFDQDTLLYAIWGQGQTLHLYFRDSREGEVSGLPATMEIQTNVSHDVQIPDQIPEKTGLIFAGWNTLQDGTGTAYAPGSTITLTGDTVLWARWESAAGSWVVIYNANGGTSAPASQIIPEGQNAVLSGELPAWKDRTFLGWSTDPSATESVYQPGATLPYDSAKSQVVLYAVWYASPDPSPEPGPDPEPTPPVETVVLTFDANGGIAGSVPDSRTIRKDVWFTLPTTQPAWDAQHDFRGWARDAGAKDPAWLAGGTAILNQDTTLYAVWRAHYQIIEGAGSVWNRGGTSTQRFVGDGKGTYYSSVRIDGTTVTDGVTVTFDSTGNTVVDISAEVMNRLSDGNHTITVVYRDGEASAPFSVVSGMPTPTPTASPTVTPTAVPSVTPTSAPTSAPTVAPTAVPTSVPKTGDTDAPVLWLVLILSGAVLLAAFIRRDSRSR